jgi:hypothetical protein
MPVNESNTIQYTVTTTRVPDGTTLYWKTTGNTTNSDIVGGNTGSITINNNRAVFNVALIADVDTDGTKTLGINLLTGSINGTSVTSTSTPIVVNDSSQTPTPYTIEYLVVAGGGAGSDQYGGGGGAGGVLNNTASVVPGIPYTITVGAGGQAPRDSGNPSSISGAPPLPLAITAIGGGGGGGSGANPGAVAKSGGSGGGGGLDNVTGGAGTPGQGFPGGNGGPGPNVFGGAGGGGAGAAGTNFIAGPGGVGRPISITGTSVFYGGGGGGARNSPFNEPGGNGGTGGGGRGAGAPEPSYGFAVSGTVNTGGGAGSGLGGPAGPAKGGSGIVILAVPTPNYPGSAPGATVTTPPAAPGKTILTYTSSGTFTA